MQRCKSKGNDTTNEWLWIMCDRLIVCSPDLICRDSSMEYEKVEPSKPSVLMEALTVWDDVKSASDKKSQEISAEQRADDALLSSRVKAGGQTPIAEADTKFDAVHKSNVIACRFSTDAKSTLMISGGADKLLKVTDWKTQTVSASVDCKGPILSVDVHPTHPHIVLVGCMNNTHCIVDTSKTGTPQAVVQEFKDHSKYVVVVRWAPDGKHFFTASHDKSLNVYSQTTTTAATTTTGTASDAKSVAAAASASEFGGWSLKRSFPFVGAVECAVWLKDGLTVLCGVRNDPYLHAVNVVSFEKTGKYNLNARLDDHVSFTPLDLVLSGDGQFLAVPTDGHRVIIFRTLTTRQVRNLYGLTADGFSNPRVAWSLDGAYLYATSQDHTVVVWDVTTGKTLHKLSGHNNTIRDLAHHPTLELVITCGFDKTVRLWRPKADAKAGSGGDGGSAAAVKK